MDVPSLSRSVDNTRKSEEASHCPHKTTKPSYTSQLSKITKMAPLSIKVSGISTITHHPEQAVLSITVRSESAEKDVVSKAVTATSNELHALFTKLSSNSDFDQSLSQAPVAIFSSTSLSTGFVNEYNNYGEFTGPTHHASISYSVRFRDFSKLNEVIFKLAIYPNLEINSIEWCLTDETKKSFASEFRKLAMQDAVLRANDYAEVIGRKVVATEISEGVGSDYQMSHMVKMPTMPVPRRVRQPMMFQEPKTKDIDMTPHDIKLTGSVNVKFVAIKGA